MKIKNLLLSTLLLCSSASVLCGQDIGLKDVAKGKFLVGAAINMNQVENKDAKAIELLDKHFNAIVAENCMKGETVHPEEDRYDFKQADEFVRFGERHGMTMTGHCLIWHSQPPKWFFTDKEGKLVSAKVMKQRMKEHIYTVVKRYKGKLKGWDVVNEAIEDDGSWRQSPFYKILGKEYIPLAFQYAHEADPDIELYYNDYNMGNEKKRNTVVALIKDLKRRGLRIDAVGMQGHMGMDYPDIKEFEKSILAYAGTGVKVMITEWEMSALPTVSKSANISDKVAYEKQANPYTDGLPSAVSNEWNNRMGAFFNLFLKHADVITRVTVWGITDKDSWKNDYPIEGRTDYPLLFDRSYQPKAFVKTLINNYKNQ